MSTNPCGGIDFLQGGTITQTTVLNSEILNSAISASTFNSGHITTLASIDEASTTTLIKAILSLPPDQLEAFATALLTAAAGNNGVEPGVSESEALPTTMVGDRKKLLGEPSSWGQLFGKSVPLY